MKNARTRTAGFSLLELLLSLAVFTGLMMAAFGLLRNYAERELARGTAKYMATVASAMDQVLDNPDNFEALYAGAVATGGGYQLIADSTAPAQDNIAKNFQVGGRWIQGSRILNARFRQTAPIRSPVRILLRVADNPALATDTPALDVVIVTAAPRPDGIVRRAAAQAGEAGGFIRNYSGKENAIMQHAYGSWNVRPQNGLQATPWYTAELRTTLDSGPEGSYLVHYMYVNYEEKVGDYLYRVTDPHPTLERNTMYSSFNLGSNDIVGVDDLNIGNGGSANVFPNDGLSGADDTDGIHDDCEGANRVLCVRGTAALKGSGTINGTMTVNGAARIADSASISTLRIQNGLDSTQKDTYGADSLFVVDGNGNDGGGTQDTVNIGTASLRDGTTAQTGDLGIITATTVAMPDGGVMTTGTISSTRRITAETISGASLSAERQLKAGVIRNGNVNITGRTGVIDVQTTRDLRYGTAASPRTLVAPKIDLGTMSVQNFGTCTSGCAN